MLRRRLSKDDLSPKNIFRKFLDFLNSSVWNLPLSMFIEQKSVVFDQEQENPELYETIHKEYSALIDTLIECFCDDLHITVNQLIASLKHDDNKARLTEEQQVLLEPVLAAQDMNTFVAMMIRKNVELQLQALQMIELVCGLVPSVLDVDDEDLLEDKGKPRRKTGWSPKEETERYILIKVLRQSKLDYERDEAARREAKIQLERALKESLYDRQQFQLASNSDEKTLIETMKQSLLMEGEKKQQEIAKKLIRGTDKTASESKVEQAECGTKAEISSSVEALTLQESSLEERGDATKRKVELGAVQNPIKGRTAADINALLQDSPNSISAEQIKLRSEYLRSQRDKLLELKKAERAKQFALLTEATAAERPRTSKAARGAMEGHLPKPTNEDPIIAARRAIASKLKVEVVKPT